MAVIAFEGDKKFYLSGRGRLNDARRSVGVASNDGKGGTFDKILSHLQLRFTNHRTLDLALRKVQVQTSGQGHPRREAGNDCRKGEHNFLSSAWGSFIDSSRSVPARANLRLVIPNK